MGFQPLDRDGPTGRSQWSFFVVASDGEFESSSRVIVNVKDVNDNSPFFAQSVIEAAVTENRPKGEFYGK